MSYELLIPAVVVALFIGAQVRYRLRSPAARKLVGEGAALVDVRTPGEFRAGHLEGAVNLPLAELPESASKIPRDRPVVVYCASGTRSAQAASLLRKAGYRQVLNLGPISAW